MDDVLAIIKGSSIKYCSLDPVPASLFKNVICDLLPSITQITNMSHQSGIFPKDLKKALVTPLLKKASLDPEIKKNYRPISNLAFLGKVIERAAIKQYVDYLTVNELFARSQSVYCQYHSTETALLRVCDDILRSLDKPHGEVILVLLDLTATFDTIDHALLLQRLRQRYGIGGKVLQWFESYLHQREQSVLINTSKSDPLTMEWGIPQGSIGGPILLVSYMAPVEDIIHAHGLSCVIYADDTQLYISMKSSQRSVTIERIEQCISDIKAWMTRNFLVLNDSKTEVLHFTSRFAKNPSIANITAGEAVVNLVPNARDLGVILDTHMTMRPHINNITRSASFALKKISSIWKYLDGQSCEKLVHAFISSRLDNCNSLLINLPDKEAKKKKNSLLVHRCPSRGRVGRSGKVFFFPFSFFFKFLLKVRCGPTFCI